jgi:hypothetical protein
MTRTPNAQRSTAKATANQRRKPPVPFLEIPLRQEFLEQYITSFGACCTDGTPFYSIDLCLSGLRSVFWLPHKKEGQRFWVQLFRHRVPQSVHVTYLESKYSYRRFFHFDGKTIAINPTTRLSLRKLFRDYKISDREGLYARLVYEE